MDTKQNFSLWYIVAVMFVMMAIQSLLLGPHAQVLAYSDFQALLQSGKVKEVTIADDQLTGIADLSGLADAAARKSAPAVSLDKAPSSGGPEDREFTVARVPDANLVSRTAGGEGEILRPQSKTAGSGRCYPGSPRRWYSSSSGAW